MLVTPPESHSHHPSINRTLNTPDRFDDLGNHVVYLALRF
jgi:hypothetical protein